MRTGGRTVGELRSFHCGRRVGIASGLDVAALTAIRYRRAFGGHLAARHPAASRPCAEGNGRQRHSESGEDQQSFYGVPISHRSPPPSECVDPHRSVARSMPHSQPPQLEMGPPRNRRWPAGQTAQRTPADFQAIPSHRQPLCQETEKRDMTHQMAAGNLKTRESRERTALGRGSGSQGNANSSARPAARSRFKGAIVRLPGWPSGLIRTWPWHDGASRARCMAGNELACRRRG